MKKITRLVKAIKERFRIWRMRRVINNPPENFMPDPTSEEVAEQAAKEGWSRERVEQVYKLRAVDMTDINKELTK